MRRPPALVLLNPGAGGGRGRARLARAWPQVVARFDPRVVELDETGAWRGEVQVALDDGVRHFVAAGGDGTVGALADALWHECDRVSLPAITLGAVGIGSSNDFHKPVRSERRGCRCGWTGEVARRGPGPYLDKERSTSARSS
jgi:diacylglycerol kinase family enzyme